MTQHPFLCDLVSATNWMHDANDVLAPRFGLSALPIVDCRNRRRTTP